MHKADSIGRPLACSACCCYLCRRCLWNFLTRPAFSTTPHTTRCGGCWLWSAPTTTVCILAQQGASSHRIATGSAILMDASPHSAQVLHHAPLVVAAADTSSCCPQQHTQHMCGKALSWRPPLQCACSCCCLVIVELQSHAVMDLVV